MYCASWDAVAWPLKRLSDQSMNNPMSKIPSRPAKASTEHPEIGLADIGVEQGRTGESHQFGDAPGTRRTRTTFAGRLPFAGGTFASLGAGS